MNNQKYYFGIIYPLYAIQNSSSVKQDDWPNKLRRGKSAYWPNRSTNARHRL